MFTPPLGPKLAYALRRLLCAALILPCACDSSLEAVDTEPTPTRGELTESPCSSDWDCDDGVYCNGLESCDDNFCRLGLPPQCDDGIECTVDSCAHLENGCRFVPPDEDGDGHYDASCRGPDDSPLGDDCDDEDPNRFPGNEEVCLTSAPDHDEDCDPQTVGLLDMDLDGSTSSACCNDDDNGARFCGADCNDDNYSVYPERLDGLYDEYRCGEPAQHPLCGFSNHGLSQLG